MSALSELAGTAGGNFIWRAATAVLAGLLLVVSSGAGVGWWLAAAARDKALDDLLAEQGINAELRAGIVDQNRAIQQWYEASKAAEARGLAAQQAAAANGRRYDQALAQLAGARATTCDEAMPYVNKVLESVR